MYITASDACNMQSGQTPLSPAVIAASQALQNSADASVINANQNWNNIVDRTWQSFSQLGPYVSMQLRNVPAGSAITNAIATSAPPDATPSQGVDLVATGNRDGSNPAAGGTGNRSRYRALTRGNVPLVGSPTDEAQFIQKFGLPPVQTYTGPLPPKGSPLSLVYGGFQRTIPVGPGVYPGSGPDQRFGYNSQCRIPLGSSMSPVGEPSYPGGYAAGDSIGSGMAAIIALLGLAGVAFLADRNEKKKRGKKS